MGSGWFVAADDASAGRFLLGDEVTRTPEMHSRWWESISKFTSPEIVVIVDSKSLQESPLKEKKSIVWIDLDKNYGHSTAHIGKYCGWMRTHFILSGLLAASDADWLVFVEQDVLLLGQDPLREEIARSKSGIFFGSADSKIPPMQQSIYGIRRDRVHNFNKRLECITFRDGVLSPESKFLWAASRIPISILNALYRALRHLPKFAVPKRINLETLANQLVDHLCVTFRKFDFMTLQGGRDRPINWKHKNLYITHASKDELTIYEKKLRG